MVKDKEFIKNTIILFLGKFSTQFISLLLLPLYTHFLLTDDYGAVDLIQTYITLLIPILTFRVDSAAFRFLVDKRNDEKYKTIILTNIIILLLLGISGTVLIGLVVNFYWKIDDFYNILINLIVLMINNVLIQILRGLGKVKEYSLTSLFVAIITLIINIILIVGFKQGAVSILISSSVANLISIIYVIYNVKLYQYINFSNINTSKLKEILRYTIPMIPNYLSWWIVNVSDRTIISIFLGVAYNGIYTVSCKFSNILNSIFSIINLSWQESATLHINDTDKDEYFSSMIDKILKIFTSLSIIIISILPICYNILIGNQYRNAYNYIPILLYANVWNVLIGLVGGIYVANKRTKEIANTTIMSAILNLLINVLCIKYIGLYAACISTLLSYVIMGIYRYIDCRKYVVLKLDIKAYIVMSLFYVLICIQYYIINSFIIKIIIFLLTCIYLIYLNRYFITEILEILKNRFIRLKTQ